MWQIVGHKKPLVGVHFEDQDKINDRDQFFAGSGNIGRNLTGKLVARCYTISEDRVISQGNAVWKQSDDMDHEASNGLESVGNDAVDCFSGHATNSGAHQSSIKLHTTDQAHAIVKAHWGSTFRHYFNANSSANTVVSTSYSSEHSLLVVGFSTGRFGLYELPPMSNIHTLSLSHSTIGTVSISPSEWLA